MKSVKAAAPIALLLGAACTPQPEATTMANPAATFCIEQGGSYALETANQPATCTLADGRVVDAWDFFQANAGG